MGTEAIVNIVAEDAREEHRSVPVLIIESIIPTDSQLGLSTAGDGAVLESRITGGAAIAVAVLIAGVIYRNTFAINTCPLVGVECAERFPLNDALSPTVGRYACNHWIALLEHRGLVIIVRELVNRVAVVRKVESGIPSEVLGLHRNGINRDLETLVGDFTYVGVNVVLRGNVWRNGIVPDQVGGVLDVVLDAT